MASTNLDAVIQLGEANTPPPRRHPAVKQVLARIYQKTWLMILMWTQTPAAGHEPTVDWLQPSPCGQS